jgi:FkbM family methyltransferase
MYMEDQGNAVHWSGFGYCPDYKKPVSIIPKEDTVITSASGCCMCISREYFAEVGGFDERFFMYMEDQEYSARGRSLGYIHLLSTKSRVLHDYAFKLSFGKIIMLAKGWVVSRVTHSTRARVQRILFLFGFLCSHLVKGVFVYKDYISLHIKLFINKVGAVVEIRDGARYMVRSGYFDIATLDQIYIEHVYDPPGFELRDTDVVFDVGGYIGDYAVYAARRTQKGYVYSFEPVLETFRLLKKNKDLNSLSNLSCFQYGLSDSNRSAVFHAGIHVAQPGASAYKLDRMGYDTSEYKKESVVLRKFGDVVRELGVYKIDVLKIDCEGEEFALLYSMDKSLLQTCRICMIEYHDIHLDVRFTGTALCAYLAKCGFKVTKKQYKLASNTGMIYAKNLVLGVPA